jgi:hypothetical protein
MSSRTTLLLALVSTLLVAPSRAEAQPPPGPDLLRLAQQVGLSANQVAQIKKLGLASRREEIGVNAKLQTAQLDLHEAMEADTPPAEKKVMGLVDRVGQLETQAKKIHVLMMLRVRATMNKAQWDKLQLLHAQRQGPHPGPGAPPHAPAPPHPPR